MEIEIKLPELGDGIKSGDILEVLVQVGDEIERDQGVVEVETDKATVTLPSSQAGRVKQIHVKPGDTVLVGGRIVTLEQTVVAAAPVAPTPPKPPEPEKPTAAVPAPAPAPQPQVSPQQPAAENKPNPKPSVTPSPVQPANPVTSSGALAAGPAVRRFAREVGVELSNVTGTGEHGRITRDDVLSVVRAANQVARGGTSSPVAATSAPVETQAVPATTKIAPPKAATASVESISSNDAWGPVRIEKLAKIRRTIAAKMHESWTTVPRVTNFDDADVTELERMRQSSKEDYAARGVKLTSLPFVIKSIAMALRNHPVLNASLDLENGTVIYKEYVHVGIAIDSDRGLVVPVLRNADQLSISEIARQLTALTEKVRDGAFVVDDLRGGTFTVSNLGAIGGTYSTPIINTPEVAILLVGRSRKLPVVIDDEIVPRLMMPLSLSYDHRLVDGGAAARFLNDVIAYLRAPGRLLLAP